ncbi:O-methyltransferase [Actinoplanes sp. NPDC051859]|uniref:O-methyltransferase n=1 Tax=Actinoplanes sp. NPDC051859 TaxID=3363909 RepID=UPI0037B6F620
MTRMNRLRGVAVAAIAAVTNPLEVPDDLRDVQVLTRRHRRTHRCGAVAYGEGSLPATLAAAVDARRIIEVGTALGYTAMSMARAVPAATVETIELADEHVRIARAQIAARGLAGRVIVRHGAAETILPALDTAGYDLAFFDGFTPTVAVLREFHRLLRPGGVVVAGNLILGPDPRATRYLADTARWRTHSFGETALCVKIP